MKCKVCSNPTNDPIGICAVCKVMGKVNGEPLPIVEQKPVKQKSQDDKSCVTEGCERKYYAKGYCYPCYKKFIVRPKLRAKKQGSESPTSQPQEEKKEIGDAHVYIAMPEEIVNNGKCSIIGQLLYASDQLDKQIKMVMAESKIDSEAIIDIKGRLNYVLAEMAGR